MAAAPGVEVVFGAEVDGADPDGRVRYTTADGPQEATADLVVGADGIHSVVRDGGAFGADVGATGSTYLRGLVPPVDDLGGEAWTSLGPLRLDRPGRRHVLLRRRHPPLRPGRSRRPGPGRAPGGLVGSVAGQPSGCSTPSTRSTTCSSTPSSGSTARPGSTAGSCCWATPPTPWSRRSARAPTAPSSTPPSWPSSWRPTRRPPTPSPRTTPAAVPRCAKVQRDADRLARASRLRSAAARGLRDVGVRAAARPGPSAKRYRAVQQEDPAELLAQVRTATMGR